MRWPPTAARRNRVGTYVVIAQFNCEGIRKANQTPLSVKAAHVRFFADCLVTDNVSPCARCSCLLRESDRLRSGSLKVEHLGRISWRLLLAKTALCGPDFEFSPEE